jgi:hypothetical protein
MFFNNLGKSSNSSKILRNFNILQESSNSLKITTFFNCLLKNLGHGALLVQTELTEMVSDSDSVRVRRQIYNKFHVTHVTSHVT